MCDTTHSYMFVSVSFVCLCEGVRDDSFICVTRLTSICLCLCLLCVCVKVCLFALVCV